MRKMVFITALTVFTALSIPITVVASASAAQTAVLMGGAPVSAQIAMPENARTIMPENKVPARVESTARRLMHQLDKQGYEVLRGYFKVYTTDDCDLSYKVMHTCYANNPAAPYVVPVVPPWPDQPGPGEWVDPATIGAFGETADGYNVSYRLDPHEALVILAQMPPPAAYFGVKTYLFTRAGELCDGSNQYSWVQSHVPGMFGVFFSLVPNEPKSAPRVEIIADLSNSTNNVVIKNQSHRVWDQLRYFVVTPNPTMDHAIRNAFAKIGIADHDIFTEKIPGQFPEPDPKPSCPDAAALRFGLDQQADDFATVIRYAMPVDAAAADSWRQRLPLVVLRIRNLAADDQTYPWADFEQRTASHPPETWYSSALDTLTQAVCDTWKEAGTTPHCNYKDWQKLINMQTPGLLLTGPDCVPAWMNCLAPNEDTTYQMSAKLPLDPENPLDPEHFYALVGPLSTATHNATYVALGLNSSVYQLGFDNISDEDLAGSATGYSNAVPKHKFFVQYFARDCSGLAEHLPAGVTFHCYSIEDKLQSDCNDPKDVKCDMLVLSLRGYIHPGTQRAADKDSVLNSRYIRLNRPNP
jgi:hypothetical protein